VYGLAPHLPKEFIAQSKYYKSPYDVGISWSPMTLIRPSLRR